jgi:hypothetical protein
MYDQGNGVRMSALKVIITVLCSVVILLLGTGVTSVLSRTELIEHDMKMHTDKPGHPVVLERVTGVDAQIARVEKDVGEIKKDVKTLLLRGNP